MKSIRQDKKIEDACAAVTVALVSLVEAIAAAPTLAVPHPMAKTCLGGIGARVPPRRSVPRRRAGAADFAAAAYRQRWQPGIEVACYFAGCAGVSELAKAIGHPIYKVGCADPARIRVRLAELNADRWAGAKAGCGVVDDGFDDWAVQLLEHDAPVSPGSPVRVERRDVRVTLPIGMTLRSFDGQLSKALEPMSLHQWISSDEGRTLIERKALDPASFDRTTLYAFGTSIRTSKAKELMLVRPRADLPVVIRLIEELIFAAVTAGPVLA